MRDFGERVATLENQTENMETKISEIEKKQEHLSRLVFMMLGGVMVLQVVSTLWLTLLKSTGGH